MKLQYYLRGLGIGILVTAMIFCVLPGEKEALSDEEIRARAAELGMVESSSLTLADIQNKQQAEKETQSPEVQQESAEVQKPEETESTAESDNKAEKESLAENQSSTKTESAELTEGTEAAGESETVESPENFEGAAEVLKITIESGAGSYTVSKLLEESLLIEDAGEFDNYLISNGYSRKIRVGTHEIPVDATWEEIAKIITNPLQ